MINVLEEIKWYYNKFLGNIESYLAFGTSIRLKEKSEFFEYLFTTKDGKEVYINIIDEIKPDDRYFIIYKESPSLARLNPEMARIKLTEAKYVNTKNPFSKRWILSKEEKRNLYESLISKTEWSNTRNKSAWEMMYERSEQDSKGLGWNSIIDIEFPSMPDYMKL